MNWKEGSKIWFNGELVDWADAKIHVLSHVVHYGSSVFEGIRAYNTPNGTQIFRLDEHIRRLYDSAKIYRMEIPYSYDSLRQATIDTVRANGLKACYIRPIVFRGYRELGVNPFSCPVDSVIAVWEWGAYLGQGALDQGVDVHVSSWSRLAHNTMPSMAKSGANYANSALIKMEAIVNGYSEAIALDTNGLVSEGSGQNLFLVRDGILYTPSVDASLLVGITRNTVMDLAREIGLEVREHGIPREMLYISDEIFMTGTAAEISPVRSVDKIQIGAGKRGPITEQLQKRFFSMINGELESHRKWLTPVDGL